MKNAVVHDYADLFRRTPAYARLAGHEVRVLAEASADPARLVAAVFGNEPITGAAHPSLGMSNVLCMQHLGYAAGNFAMW